jgi:hypothetical protein
VPTSASWTSACFERELMLERQREGIAKAKAEGKYKGRKPTAQARSAEIKALKADGVRPPSKLLDGSALDAQAFIASSTAVQAEPTEPASLVGLLHFKLNNTCCAGHWNNDTR